MEHKFVQSHQDTVLSHSEDPRGSAKLGRAIKLPNMVSHSPSRKVMKNFP